MYTFRRARISLAIRYFLLTAGAFVVSSVIILFFIQTAEMRGCDTQLRKQAGWLQDFAKRPRSVDALSEDLTEIMVAASSLMGAIIYNGNGQVMLRQGLFARSVFPLALLSSQAENMVFAFEDARLGRVRATVVPLAFPVGGKALLGASMAEWQAVFRRLIFTFALGDIIAALVVSLLAWRLAASVLEPVQESYKRMQTSLSSASHELRTPLAAILGEAEVAVRIPREVAEYRETIERCAVYARQMMGLVENVLELSRAEVSASMCDVQLVDLGHVARSEAEALQRQFPDGPRIDCQMEPECMLMGNLDLLGVVVSNLLDNAAKHTPPSGEITVRVEQLEGRDGISLVVADNGEGIAPEHLPHILERFYRVDHARSQQGDGGYGLGLAIAEAVVSAHGGTVGVKSKLGVGSVFTVRLPGTTAHN